MLKFALVNKITRRKMCRKKKIKYQTIDEMKGARIDLSTITRMQLAILYISQTLNGVFSFRANRFFFFIVILLKVLTIFKDHFFWFPFSIISHLCIFLNMPVQENHKFTCHCYCHTRRMENAFE